MAGFNRWTKVICTLAAGLVLWNISAPVLASLLIVERKLERADVIFVLSGSSAYRERTSKAAELYRKNIANVVVLSDDGVMSGWSPKDQSNLRFVELAKRSLIDAGVDRSSIVVLEPVVSGTIDEARAFSERAGKEGWQTVMLVTSTYHTRRATWAFESETHTAGIKVGVTPAVPGKRTPGIYTWWLTPRGWRYVGGEYLKSVYYWLFY